MLVLGRREGQVVIVTLGGVRVRVTVVRVDDRNGKPSVTLGFDAPGEVQINREERQARLDAIAAGRLVDVK